jgi:REP element-mobilizing transposase RayT
MPQSLAKVLIHIVFSTKNRTPWLQDEGTRKELHAYMATVLQTMESPALIINGVEDHVHILCLLSRKHAIRQIVEDVKKNSSKWIKTKGGVYKDFYWQAGYGVFSVSESKVDEARRYIGNQEEHHKTMTFQDEFRKLCVRHGVAIDERYVWD